MSATKQQLKDFLAKVDLTAQRVLSIGAQHDDRKYFKSVTVEDWQTLDSNEEFKPDILHDMNKVILNDDGDNALDMDLMESFDAVLAFELWEYIYDPMAAHDNIYNLLRPGGVYMGSYPFIYPHHNPMHTDFLRYTDWGIKKILTAVGFREIEITPRVASAGRADLINFVRAEGMRLSKELPSYEWPVGYIVKAKK